MLINGSHQKASQKYAKRRGLATAMGIHICRMQENKPSYMERLLRLQIPPCAVVN